MSDYVFDIEAIRTRQKAVAKGGWSARDIALSNQPIPLLVMQDVPALLNVIDTIRALHAPFRIYEPCEHDHRHGEEGTTYADDVGVVCADGLLYEICQSCCVNGLGEQSEACASGHNHGPEKPICATIARIESKAVPA